MKGMGKNWGGLVPTCEIAGEKCVSRRALKIPFQQVQSQELTVFEE